MKSTLLQLDSTFTERDYGASTFRDFIEKMAAAGYVHLKQVDRSLLVEISIKKAAAEEEEAPPRGRAVEPLWLLRCLLLLPAFRRCGRFLSVANRPTTEQVGRRGPRPVRCVSKRKESATLADVPSECQTVCEECGSHL